jgi:hypothetical protein
VKKKSVPELLKTRPDLDVIAKARQFVLPNAWPDDVPPIAGIQTTTAYKCLLCPPGAVVRRSNERNLKKHLREDHSPKEKVFGLHSQPCPIQSWYLHNAGGMGRNWRVNISRATHPLQFPVFDFNIKAYDAEYRRRMHQFLALGSLPPRP